MRETGGLDLLPEYRELSVRTETVNGEIVGVVEYLYDELENDDVKSTAHLTMIFVGQEYRYHLDFTANQDDFDSYRPLFEEIGSLFVYLK